ncbi:cyclophilin-like fold protein [Hominibacterium faecale]|uniref:cyclophilin-like fold protein n=1 Tax=Hominibacterium faecale TaxID=2839743 RepID=UPI0022B29B57|nr:cyclophilin-like fold protein [Hominibacterium faecale]
MKIGKKGFLLLTALLCAFIWAGCVDGQDASSDQSTSEESPPQTAVEKNQGKIQIGDNGNMEIEIYAGGQTFASVLFDSPAARALAEQLPITVNMQELNGNEKFYDLPNALPTDTKDIDSIHAGDLMLYGSDCLVLFYKDFQTTYRYTKLGRVEDAAGLEKALGVGDVQVTFR